MVRSAVELMNISTNHIPMGFVVLKHGTIVGLILNQCQMVEAGHIQAKCLSTSTGAYFNTGKISLFILRRNACKNMVDSDLVPAAGILTFGSFDVPGAIGVV